MSDSIGLVVIKSPEEKYSLQNVAVVSDKPPNLGNAKFVKFICLYVTVCVVTCQSSLIRYAIAGDNCYLTVVVDKRIPAGKIGLSSLQVCIVHTHIVTHKQPLVYTRTLVLAHTHTHRGNG